MKKSFPLVLLMVSLVATTGIAQETPEPAQPAPAAADAAQETSTAADETSVRQAGEAYVKAFNEKDSETLAAFWSADAVYINRITGDQVVGRSEIAEQFKSIFSASEETKLSVDVESLQFVSPNVAVEHGVATFVTADSNPDRVSYSAVYVRRDGKWLLDRVTDEESASSDEESHYEKLRDLEWIVGSWVDEDDSVRIVTDCNWTAKRNFITRRFSVAVEGADELTGMQIIGWDAKKGHIRSWTFDSDGGLAEGVWSKSDDGWFVRKKGTTPDGQATTAVNRLTIRDADSFEFQSTQRTIDGNLLPNVDEVVVVRK